MSYKFIVINTCWDFTRKSESGVLKIEESEPEVSCTDSTACLHHDLKLSHHDCGMYSVPKRMFTCNMQNVHHKQNAAKNYIKKGFINIASQRKENRRGKILNTFTVTQN
jgi:hypothetical protein